MRILFDMGHPAHVHFFRNAIRELQARGHEVKVTARDKDVTIKLLELYEIPYELRGTGGASSIKKGIGMVKIDLQMLKIARKFKPDVMCGILNPYTAQVSRIVGAKSITFTDTEHAKSAQKLTFPFTDLIVTPEAYLLDHGEKHVRYKGCHELAYLHPRYFKPDPSVLKELALADGEKFAIVRFVSWEASHDKGYSGISPDAKVHLVERISKFARPIITSEGPLPAPIQKFAFKIPPHRILDALAFASLYIGEGATMAHEAIILGTPSIYVSDFSDLLGIPTDFRKKGLLRVVKPSELAGLDIGSIDKAEFGKRAGEYVKGSEDVTGVILDKIIIFGNTNK